MEISFGLAPAFLILGAAVAAVASFLSYRGTTPVLTSGRRWLLAGLRFASLFIILFLLFEPILARLTTITDEAILAVLIDTSESMQMEGPEGDPVTPAQTAVGLLGSLRESLGPAVRGFTFDSDVEPIDFDAAAVDSIAFDGQRTDVASALEEVRGLLSESNLGGVLLISDGRYTAGRNPRHVADRFDVPVFTVVLGDSLEKRDVRISRVTTNEITYAGVALPIDVGITSTGFAGARLAVSVAVGDSTVGSAAVEAPSDGTERSTSLTYTPTRPGPMQLTVRVTGLEGEATYRNNLYTTSVRVLDRRRRVLFIGSGPDPDVASMRQILESDENNEVIAVIQRGGSGYYGTPLPSSFADVDIVVLAGFPAPSARVTDIRRIAEAIEGGVPGLFVMTRQTDFRLFEQTLSAAFGTTIRGPRRAFYESVPVATGAGRRHPIVEDLWAADAWLRLPPVATNETAWAVAADARVLATVRVRGIDLSDPLLAIRARPGHRTALFLGAGTWRLANLPEGLGELQNQWPDLLANLVQWVSAAEDDRAVRIRTTEREFAGGDPVGFVGQVYDESLNPVEDAEVTVTVTAPSGDEYRYSMDPVGSGRYVLDAGPLAEGTYRYRGAAIREGVGLGDDSGSFVVGNLALEFRNPVSDPLLMRQISLRSGGATVAPDGVSRLPEILDRTGRFEPRLTTRRAEDELWRRPLFLVVVIVCLAAEWVLRKRSGLS